MHGFIHITSLDWLLVNISNFMPHHTRTLNQHSMHAFRSELIAPITFMGFFIKGQFIKNLSDIVLSKILNHLFRRP